MDGFLEFWGQGGFFELKIQSRGLLMIGIQNKCIPWKRLFYGLISLQINHDYPLISDDFWFICKKNKTLVVHQAPEALMPQKHPFFFCENSLKLFCPFIAKQGLLTKDAI